MRINKALGEHMSLEKLFVAYFVMVYEDVWFEFESDIIKRKEISYGLQGQMFISSSIELAYEMATAMIDGMSNANNDGKGDQFRMYSSGINNLEEVSYFDGDFRAQLSDTYGIDCGHIDIENSFNDSFKPIVKSKNEILKS